jgi:peroxiredoxin family protein
MIFFNGGAHLTCEGSESVEDIKELESRGTKILTCGTCLDFYGIRDKLAVGGVTNLYEIAETFTTHPGTTTL